MYENIDMERTGILLKELKIFNLFNYSYFSFNNI